MKFKVSDSCIGCGACAQICENVFSMNEDNLAEASSDVVNESDVEEATSAMENCPVDAIYIKKDE